MQLFRSRVCWTVASCTFLAVLVVEIIILIPSYLNYSKDWQTQRSQQVLLVTQSLYRANDDSRGEAADLQNIFEKLVESKLIRGWQIADAHTTRQGGDAPLPLPAGQMRKLGSEDTEAVLDVHWQDQALWQPVSVAVRIDLHGLQKELNGFLARIAMLVGIISVFVTSATMLVLNQQVLKPVLDLYAHVRRASIKGDDYQSRIANRSPKTELGLVISAFNKMLARIERNLHEAQYDSLTRLPNRALGLDFLQQSINRAERDQHNVAVMFIDLDHFKEVNDSLGHGVGDELLIEASRRLAESVDEGRGSKLVVKHNKKKISGVSRIGGDEFMVVLPDICSEDAVIKVAEHIKSAFQQPFELKRHQQHYVGASIGLALYPRDGGSPQELLMSADTALYAAKDAGRGHYQFFSASMNSDLIERLDIEAALRVAIQENQFEVYYQPIFDIQNKEISGVEALIRWRHPEKSWLSPEVFIPIAEATGLIVPIGEWVLTQACEDIGYLHKIGHRLSLAVNVSYQQFRDCKFVDTVTDVLNKTEFPSRSLELEITEGTFIDEQAHAQTVIDSLSARGIRFAIDDFGTGYSALSYLRRFNVHTLKIDRTFIRGVPENAQDIALCKTIMSMAKSFEMKIVAEGVEDQTQSSFLDANACDYAQGYYFAKPMNFQDLQTFLRADTQVNQV